ncbi:MAG: hypothetical protein WDN31_09285 [Hyphomicrobium sp.]
MTRAEEQKTKATAKIAEAKAKLEAVQAATGPHWRKPSAPPTPPRRPSRRRTPPPRRPAMPSASSPRLGVRQL